MKKPRIEINSYYGIISVRAFSDGKKYVLENEMLIRFLEKKLKKGEYTLEKGRERRNYKWKRAYMGERREVFNDISN